MSNPPHNTPIKNVCVFGPKSNRICDNTDPSQEGYCVNCFDRTFAACEKAVEWSVRNENPAYRYMRSGRGSAWFTCATCAHDYSALFTHACKPGRGAPCPFCSGSQMCENPTCVTCARARAKPPKTKISDEIAQADAEAGRRTCDICRDQKDLTSFNKLPSGKRRTTCSACRNNATKRREQERINEAKADNRVATRVCGDCNCTKSLSEFSPGGKVCHPCRARKDAERAQAKANTGDNTQMINGLPHRGDIPGPCRNCTKPFTLENAGEFRYRKDTCKYMNHCNSCRAEHERTTNNCEKSRNIRKQENPDQYYANNNAQMRAYRSIRPEVRAQARIARNTKPELKLNAICRSARDRKLTFAEEDSEDMLAKIKMPCHYCGITAEENDCISGLDRVDNQQGYSAPNTVPCCAKCNMMKGTLTLSEFENQILQCALKLHPQYINPNVVIPPREVRNDSYIQKKHGKGMIETDANRELVSAAPPAKRARKFPTDTLQGVRVVFYNKHTGRIAHLVPSIKDAGAVVGIEPEYTRTIIHRDVDWIDPNWRARRESDHDDPPCPEEKAAMLAALSRGGNCFKKTSSYRLTDVTTHEVIEFPSLTSLAAAVDVDADKLTRQFNNGATRVVVNSKYYAERVEGRRKKGSL